jgi:hypothetical protein
LDELEDLPLLSIDSEQRSLAKTKSLEQPVGVVLDGSNPQVIAHLLIGSYRTAVLLDVGRLKIGDEVYIPLFIQSLLSRSDLRFVGSGIFHDLPDFRRLGLVLNADFLIDTQEVEDYRAHRHSKTKLVRVQVTHKDH